MNTFKYPISKKEVAIIQAMEAAKGHPVGKGSYASLAQSAADHNPLLHTKSGLVDPPYREDLDPKTRESPYRIHKSDARSIQSHEARRGHYTGKGSTAALFQSLADKNIAEFRIKD